MPDIKTDDGCIIHVEVEGPQKRSGADAVEFARHQSAHAGRPGAGLEPSIPPGALRSGAVMANPACRRGPIRWSGSAATCLRSSMPWASPKSVGADCRWAAWSDSGLAPMPPARVDKLILSNTSSYFADKALWEGRFKTVREKGLAAIVDANMERWFTKEFRDRNPQAMARMREMFLATKSEGYIGCGEGIRNMDHRPLLAKVGAPTLVIAGNHDLATPLEANEFIRRHIAGAQIAVLDAAHIANVEQPQIYADTVLKFLLGK
jgi:3-oxoadipate enol-lactonase